MRIRHKDRARGTVTQRATGRLRRRIGGALCVTALALTASACGSDGKSSSTTAGGAT
ncbi:MAG: hypothetical protein JWM12_1266, partial [Ilumatobacteraceae bacterium]|nr:hypothetical protein [Ilumatobacteraceae bacterium]